MNVEAFRELFPIVKRTAYFASCVQGALATPVSRALQEYQDVWDRRGADWPVWRKKTVALREAFARMINADAQDVAITFCASTGLNSFASALEWGSRSRVVTTEFEFPTAGHVWLAQERRGARVVFARARGGLLTRESFDDCIDEETLVVSATHGCYSNGAKTDLATIARLAHARGALLVTDAYQTAGTEPIDVKALGVDCLVTGTMKWLLGTYGLAFIYVRRELADSLRPSDSGWYAQADRDAMLVDQLRYADGARRFETGTPTVSAIYAAEAALALVNSVGLGRIREHIVELSSHLISGALALGLMVRSPVDAAHRSAVVSIGARDVATLLERLAGDGIMCSSRDGALRVAFHYYNTAADVDRLLNALGASADLLR